MWECAQVTLLWRTPTGGRALRRWGGGQRLELPSGGRANLWRGARAARQAEISRELVLWPQVQPNLLCGFRYERDTQTRVCHCSLHNFIVSTEILILDQWPSCCPIMWILPQKQTSSTPWLLYYINTYLLYSQNSRWFLDT